MSAKPPPRRDPVADADAASRAEALSLLETGHAALAWTDPDTGTPGISRITFARDPEAGPMTLISGLAPHCRALKQSPDCALMVGEVGPKGDAMTHPRLMIRARAEFVPGEAGLLRDQAQHPQLLHGEVGRQLQRPDQFDRQRPHPVVQGEDLAQQPVPLGITRRRGRTEHRNPLLVRASAGSG